MKRSILAAAVVATVVGGSSATAAQFITGQDIKDGSITARDIREGGITLNRLTPGAQALLRSNAANSFTGNSESRGAQGEKGDTGAQGPQGLQGVKGDTGPAGKDATGGDAGNWGVVFRNVIGSPDIDLRGGPASALPTAPPFGTGSLSFLVKDATEKAAYGNEVDFAGDLVSDLTQVGFRVFTTGENSAKGNPNMPSIAFEIDPNLAALPATNFSTLVWTPDANSPTNQWSGFLDATTTGKWGLTGSAFNTPATLANCGLNGPRCTFAQVQALLADAGGNPATILTAQVTKGRDFEWQGAIDGLRINDRLFDFEEDGVNEKGA